MLSNRPLVCVKFPGIVKNDEKAIRCLGGIRNISEVYSETAKKRLEISFQPENPFIKKMYADACKAAGVLIKVRVKKTKVNDEVKREVVSTTIMGRVSLMYQFDSMCDFQYLPIENAGEPNRQCMLEKLLPTGLDSVNFLNEPCPLFTLPLNFTRSDKPMPYLYTFKKYLIRKGENTDDDDVHHRKRGNRGLPEKLFTFNLVDDLDTEPNQYYVKQKEERQRVYPPLEKEYAAVAKLFEQKPIWTISQIKFETKIRTQSLKTIMPCLGVQMRDGPWKTCWVKFGYDPRKEPGARFYQTLDFRLRSIPGRSLVLTRDKAVHKVKKTERARPLKRRHDDNEQSLDETVAEGAVFLRPGLVPSQRQIYYQYGNLQLPEVQELLAAEPPPGYLCHPKRGWLPPNTDEVVRDHIYKYVQEAFKSTYNSELKLEQDSTDDDNSDDDASAEAEADEAGKSEIN